MPKVNIYLPDDLAAAVKDAGVPLSAVCQRALEQAVRRVTLIRQVFSGQARPGDLTQPPAVEFTARAARLIESARAEAKAAGLAQASTGHLLSAIVADENSLAVRVLSAFEITPPQVRSELHRLEDAAGEPAASRPGRPAGQRADGEAVTAAGPGLDQQVIAAVELAAIESSGLGNSYIGTEHLLLGLISEPDGLAGNVLRSLGADLRVTRRMVAAALAGWAARASLLQRHAGEAAAAASGQEPAADQLAAAIRTELAPVLSRIEQLEARLAS
jgi:ATP-dependent Clp protease ATP-binding subunit ClpA